MNETSTASPHKPKVWIVTPRKDFHLNGPATLEELEKACDPHFIGPFKELANWLECPWQMQFVVSGGGGIFQARNHVATDFVTECTNPDDRLFFRDYDLLCSAQDIVNILSHDLSIVGGLYTVRADNGHWVLNLLAGAHPNERGILPVMELGTGFKCFKRSVFAKVLADNPWLDCESDANHSKRFYPFFSMGPVWDTKLWPGKGRALTEDYWFDWLCRESGFVTCADTKIKLRHYDEYSKKTYPAFFPQDPGKLPLEAVEP